MPSCEFCGSEVPGDASFCGVCGRAAGKSQQTARGNGDYAAAGEGIPGPASNVSVPNSQRRSTRKPYQFSSQSSQPYQSHP